MSGYDSVNGNVSSRVRKVARDGADVISGGRQFHIWGPAIESAWLPTVEQWTCWTRISLQKKQENTQVNTTDL